MPYNWHRGEISKRVYIKSVINRKILDILQFRCLKVSIFSRGVNMTLFSLSLYCLNNLTNGDTNLHQGIK